MGILPFVGEGEKLKLTITLDNYLYKNAMGVGIPGADARGVDAKTAPVCKAAGANVLVSGSAFFKAEDKAAFVSALMA